MFQGNRVPESKPMSCSQATGFHNLTSVMFPGQWFPESNLSHIPRPHGSRIKPQSCSQDTGFQNQTSVMFPGHRFQNKTPVMFPGHRVPESSLTHIPRPQGSTIKPQSYSQARGFHNQTSVLLPYHGSTIKPQSCSEARVFHNQT